MCPPHARTGLAWFAVNVIVILADLSPVNPGPFAYEYALTAVIVPPYMVKFPGACVMGIFGTPLSTCGSSGIAKIDAAPQAGVTPRHGLAVPTVALNVFK